MEIEKIEEVDSDRSWIKDNGKVLGEFKISWINLLLSCD